MIDKIKEFFTPAGWVANWREYSLLVASWVLAYVLGAFGGAAIQYLKDIL